MPLDRVVAQLNIDMIGRGRSPGTPAANGPLALTDSDTVYVVGSRRLSTMLGGLLEQANARYHALHLDYSLDDASDPAQIYQRSDHYQYAKRGIPVAFFFTGVHQDYHGLEDEVDRHRFREVAARDADHLRDGSPGGRHATASEGRRASRRAGHNPLSVAT